MKIENQEKKIPNIETWETQELSNIFYKKFLNSHSKAWWKHFKTPKVQTFSSKLRHEINMNRIDKGKLIH